ncbi:MAG: hypothetical protein EOL97_02295 [Spirochaetia bacterium]|nr:hypothetical protein [Spirochaetia bacterium]
MKKELLIKKLNEIGDSKKLNCNTEMIYYFLSGYMLIINNQNRLLVFYDDEIISKTSIDDLKIEKNDKTLKLILPNFNLQIPLYSKQERIVHITADSFQIKFVDESETKSVGEEIIKISNQVERIGLVIDRLDNLIAGLKNKYIPDSLHITCLEGLLPEIAKSLVEIYSCLGGDKNTWAFEVKDA